MMASAAALATMTTTVNAFAVPVHHQGSSATTTTPTITQLWSSTIDEDVAAPPCAIPTDVAPSDVTASVLRSAMVTNVNGELVSLGDQMGSKGTTSIVVFLRHLG